MLALSKANLTEHIFKKIKTFTRELRMLCQKQKTKNKTPHCSKGKHQHHLISVRVTTQTYKKLF